MAPARGSRCHRGTVLRETIRWSRRSEAPPPFLWRVPGRTYGGPARAACSRAWRRCCCDVAPCWRPCPGPWRGPGWGVPRRSALRPRTEVAVSHAAEKRLGALPVVAGFLRRLDVAGTVDQACPIGERALSTHGQIVEALVANRLTSPLPLQHVSRWARDWAVGPSQLCKGAGCEVYGDLTEHATGVR